MNINPPEMLTQIKPEVSLFDTSKFFFSIILNSVALRFIILSATIGILFFYYNRWRRFVTLVDKIPGPPVHPLMPWLGHACIVLDLDRQKFPYGTYVLVYQIMSATNLVYGDKRLVRMWVGNRPIVLLFTPEAVEVVLCSNTLIDKSVEYKFLEPWLGGGLVTSSKGKWKTRRKILTPAFHFRILEDFLPIINEQTWILIDKLRNISTTICNNETLDEDNRCVDIVPIITLCTLDVICETAMGIKVECQANSQSDYVESLLKISSIFLMRLMRPWLWPDFTFYLSSIGREFKDSLKKMQNFTTKVVNDRKEEWINHNNSNTEKIDLSSVANSNFFYGGKKRLAFLDLLLNQHLTAKTLTIEDVREEVDTFMFAGHDTTAQAISWTLYILGLHHDIQTRVREEIDAVFDSHPHTNFIGSDDAKEMKYLDCVLKEVQRLFPTAPFIARELCEDTWINGYLVPKGTTCGIFTYALHRDAASFPNPELFIPERFMPESMVGRHPYAYIPFSAGPRNCIGQKFAFVEQKIVIANILRHFHVKAVDQRDKLIIVGEMVLRTRNGLRLIISERFDKQNNAYRNTKNHSTQSL